MPPRGQLAEVDVVVSLCRMGRLDVPGGIDHQVIGLLDTNAARQPEPGFVLADTADYLAGAGRREDGSSSTASGPRIGRRPSLPPI